MAFSGIIISLLGAIVIGLSLGLLGAGGSILTVPILVYGIGVEEKAAIASAMSIVGVISLVSVLRQHRTEPADYKVASTFILASIPATYLGAGIASFVSGGIQLLVLSLFMGLAAWRMLKPGNTSSKATQYALLPVLLAAFSVGMVTGFVGIGGGFLLVPALLAFTELAMKKAVSTSLAIISVNCAIGVLSYLWFSPGLQLPWLTILLFSFVGVLGSVLGSKLLQKLPAQSVKKAFAYLLVLMALAIAGYELRHIFLGYN